MMLTELQILFRRVRAQPERGSPARDTVTG
jgi:hypothetical protein